MAENLSEGEVGLDDEAISLSASTLLALREFALEKGVFLSKRDQDETTPNEYEPDAIDVVRAVQQHFDIKEKETIFHIEHGSVSFELLGLKRELGQTLDSTGLTIWRAADHLCEYIAHNAEQFRDKFVCELGCGLGVVAVLLNKLQVNANIVATDGDQMTLDLLDKNIASTQCDHLLATRKLWWSVDTVENQAFMDTISDIPREAEKFDLIIAADVIYEEAAIEPFVSTCADILGRQAGSQIILAFARRNVPIALFLGSAETKGFAWEKIRDCGSDGFGNEAIYRLRWRE